MNGKNLEVTPLSGMDQRIPSTERSAELVQNFTVDPQTLGWDDRIGYEPYLPGTTDWSPFSSLGRIDSVYAWSRHQGALEQILLEYGGKLYQFVTWGDTFRIDQIGTDRPLAAPGEPVTTYTPFGRFLVILDGRSEPIKYLGWPYDPAPGGTVRTFGLGWQTPPGPPQPWGIDPNPTIPSGSYTVGIYAGNDAEAPEEVGLGSSTASTVNSYRWKLTNVNNTGSESPISLPSTRVTWQTPSAGTWSGYRFVVGMEIPKGPAGTVARRLYRTKNLGDGSAAAETYYFVDEIKNNTDEFYFDHRSDNQLGNEAPSPADSIVFPAQTARFSAVFKGCLFLDGGTSEETRLYWSNPGTPDTYSALDYADLGGREAGGITGLHPHYNFLVVMRERGIDIVRGDYASGFQVVPMSASVGSKAVHTMTTIPDLGVVFLARDGVYLMGGNVDAGGVIKFQKISQEIEETIRRLNPDVMARAVAAYSPKWREWHCYFAVDGSNLPNLGIVFHADTGAWSVREGFPISALTTEQSGEFLFGHAIGDPGNKNKIEAGLFVITRRRALGQTRVNVGTPEQPIYELQDKAPPVSIYRSRWHDMGDPRYEKSVKHIYLHCMTSGDNPIPMTVRKNYGYTGSSTPNYKHQRPETVDQYVYDKATINGTTVWEDGLLTTVRYDIADHKCSQFQFQIETTNDMIITGYSLEFTAGGQLLITGKKVV